VRRAQEQHLDAGVAQLVPREALDLMLLRMRGCSRELWARVGQTDWRAILAVVQQKRRATAWVLEEKSVSSAPV
jgi:hypothetical protein